MKVLRGKVAVTSAQKFEGAPPPPGSSRLAGSNKASAQAKWKFRPFSPATVGLLSYNEID